MTDMIDKEGIKQIIPHRDPFLLIDEVHELESGVRCVAVSHVREDAFWCAGHFPGHSVMPGVLIVEALAQTGAVAILSMPEHQGKLAMFAGIDVARFRAPVTPGVTLTLTVEITRSRGRIGKGSAVATVDGTVACECELLFALTDKPA